jgi:ribonuclease P protein component
LLPVAARLRRSADFRAVMRSGVRAGRRRLVLHASTASTASPMDAVSSVRVGFVVSKAVGNSVVRHRVTRRFRHLLSTRLGTLPAGSSLVVRALPAAASASSAELAVDLDAALRRLGLTSKPDSAGEFRKTLANGTDYPNGSMV